MITSSHVDIASDLRFLRSCNDDDLARVKRQLQDSEKALCESSLKAFVKCAWHIVEDKPYSHNWHIDLVCDHLEGLADGRIENLLVNIPPATSKSLMCCVFFPMWLWINNPALRMFYASYSGDLSTRDSMKCRDIIRSEWFQNYWGDKVRIKKDEDTKTCFATTAGGWRLAVSIGSRRTTGRHPDILFVDDPHDVTQSLSDTQREQAISWYSGSVSTRGVTRGVRRGIVMQRLHERDLSGYVLASGEEWEHICLPMRYEPGRMKVTSLGGYDVRKETGDELLWPKMYSDDIVSSIEMKLGSYGASGQLQQRPSPRGGGMFKRDWFEVIPSCPPTVKSVRSWDLAATSGGGDWSSGVKMQLGKDGIKYITDVRRDRLSALKRDQMVLNTASQDGRDCRIVIEQESGSGGKVQCVYLTRQLDGYPVKIYKPDTNKVARAESFSAQSEVGAVKIVSRDPNAQWVRDLLDELESFPYGANDDQVDGCTSAHKFLISGKGFTVDRDIQIGRRKKRGGDNE